MRGCHDTCHRRSNEELWGRPVLNPMHVPQRRSVAQRAVKEQGVGE